MQGRSTTCIANDSFQQTSCNWEQQTALYLCVAMRQYRAAVTVEKRKRRLTGSPLTWAICRACVILPRIEQEANFFAHDLLRKVTVPVYTLSSFRCRSLLLFLIFILLFVYTFICQSSSQFRIRRRTAIPQSVRLTSNRSWPRIRLGIPRHKDGGCED